MAGVDYLNGRSQTVYTSKCKYDDAILQYGVPQGSVRGPRIFIEYAEDVSTIFASPTLRRHLFADDMQYYCSERSGDVAMMASWVQ